MSVSSFGEREREKKRERDLPFQPTLCRTPRACRLARAPGQRIWRTGRSWCPFRGAPC